ncbi:hypothetical protein TYRP_015672, partial [Tyrophagus putrescentiae]
QLQQKRPSLYGNTPATQQERFAADTEKRGRAAVAGATLHQHSTEMHAGPHQQQCSTLESGHQYPQPTSETFQSTLALRQNSAKALRNIQPKEVELLCLPEDLRSFVEIFFLRWSDSPVEAVDHPFRSWRNCSLLPVMQTSERALSLYGGVYVISDYSLNVLTYMTAQTETVKSVLVSMRPFIGMPRRDNAATGATSGFSASGHNTTSCKLLQSVANCLHNSRGNDTLSRAQPPLLPGATRFAPVLRCHDTIGITQSEPVNKSSLLYHHPNHHHRRSHAISRPGHCRQPQERRRRSNSAQSDQQNNPNLRQRTTPAANATLVFGSDAETISCFSIRSTRRQCSASVHCSAKIMIGDVSAMVEECHELALSPVAAGDAASDYTTLAVRHFRHLTACLAHFRLNKENHN